jgi:hypothetical protein
MALEVRLRDDARLTKDVDLGLRDDVNSAPDPHERLIDILTVDLHHDCFMFTVGPPERLRDDSGGVPTWRAKVGAQLADKPFGRVQLDVSPGTHELHATDTLAIPNSLAFAGIPAVEVEAVDIHRHAAEKLHGMLRDFGERGNSRVRDLVDLTILLEHGLLVPSERQPQSEPYGSNATKPNHRTTSLCCQSRGRTATSDLQPATLFTSRPTPQPSPT